MNQNDAQYWSNQVVLITGSSRGIGKEMAIHFSKLGAKVAINYSANEIKALEVLEKCQGDRTKTYKADVSNESDVNDMIKKIESELGAVSILINNAGVTKDGLFLTMSLEDWKKVLSIHLDGMFLCTKAVMRSMSKSRHGRIINMTSVSGIKGTPGQCNYSAAKAGIIGFTKALSREMGKRNITCNAIAPGVIETEMTAILTPEVLDDYKEATSLKRFGQPQEVAELAEFLAGPKGSYITGQVITIDGGLT